MHQNKNPFLVIVGMAGSGKSSAARHLEKKGWRVIRFGALTMRELESRHLPINEANEKAVREALRAKHGMEAYAKLLLPGIKESLSAGPTVIDGLYSWAEYKFLRGHFGDQMKLVAVYTTRSVRYARLSQRAERPLPFEEAEQRDYAEIENVEKGGPIAMADYTLFNDSTKADLFKAVDKLLSSLYTAS
ncbi:MAG: AAA family ATPase [Chloroflexi bacterium]|nr:AAA family ATPase [Chloroflexota bacterium]